jgi:hypothetical protein
VVVVVGGVGGRSGGKNRRAIRPDGFLSFDVLGRSMHTAHRFVIADIGIFLRAGFFLK